MGRVLVTGGTGLVGKYLGKRLSEEGYKVATLSRHSNYTGYQNYLWDIENSIIEKNAIESADYIIHLAGASVAEKRWTEKRKQLIIESRVKSGELILAKIKEQDSTIKGFITASGTGFYGSKTTDRIFSETDQSATDFLGETCRQWELMADGFGDIGIRTVKIRTGIVLTEKGGALSKMVQPIKLGIGAALGTGKQPLSWIHIDDLCGIYIKAIKDTSMEGAYNAVAPDHKSNREFTRTLAHVLKKPFWFPNTPALVLKILFGKMSTILLGGNMVSAEKIKKSGYKFLYPNLRNALIQLLNTK